MPDVITLITKDHRAMEKLFDRLASDRGRRPELVREMSAMLIAHSRAEEERVYPAIAEEAGEKGEIEHSEEEHKEAEETLHRLEGIDPGGPDFDQCLEELVTAVKHHIEEEEGEILPALKKAVSRKRLDELGEAFEERRMQEMSKHGFGVKKAPKTTGKTRGGVRSAVKGGKGGKAAPAGTKQELYKRAQELDISGRSKMTKDELAKAVQKAGRR
ncbi:hemerythrin domain-containing protein [Thermomonospora amylolytica]|uniref:hemerythrin domain-containing protein n=1 Tax=Thermomonospora amylolytica TaxID=1411117 RepID=UPI000E6CA7A0|nr:hemerythrin domain-containing protein [Thermomonospora amylolytica]